MDASTLEMLSQAYDETVSDALSQGHPGDVAHQEGIIAAAMFLSSMTGIEDAAARAAVQQLGLRPH